MPARATRHASCGVSSTHRPHPRSPNGRIPGRPPVGSALVELLVALTILAVGVLAVAGTTAPIARRLADGVRARRAAALLDARAERLRADSCPSPGAGAGAVDVLSERWTVAREGRLATLVDTVRLPSARGPRAVDLAAARWCAP